MRSSLAGRGGVLGASRKRSTGCGGTEESCYRLAVFAGVLVSAARLSVVACFNHGFKPPAARLRHVGRVGNVDAFPQISLRRGAPFLLPMVRAGVNELALILILPLSYTTRA